MNLDFMLDNIGGWYSSGNITHVFHPTNFETSVLLMNLMTKMKLNTQQGQRDTLFE